MRNEIKQLMNGKSLGFMASITEKLNTKSAAEYEIMKMRVAKTLIREQSEEDLEEKLHGDQHKLDHNEDGDIDAEDMKDVKKKGPNNDHPMADKKDAK